MDTQNMTFQQKLLAVQTELKAPKSQYNSFGKYKYRSLEMILEAAKPLLMKYGLMLTLSDEPIQVGDRYYVCATAVVTDGKEKIATQAYARESLEKKGMDDSQITGTASSYARKYCLNGLFLIDDTKDPDTDEYHNEAAQKAENSRGASRQGNTRSNSQNGSETAQNIQNKVNMPIEEENNSAMQELCNDIELATLESLCKKLRLKPEKVFKKWPEITKEQYGIALTQLKEKIENGNKGDA